MEKDSEYVGGIYKCQGMPPVLSAVQCRKIDKRGRIKNIHSRANMDGSEEVWIYLKMQYVV